METYQNGEHVLEFKWTESKARDSYGYTICTLFVDSEKYARTCGGGYDMKGRVLGDFISRKFGEELKNIDQEFYGLCFQNPDWEPSAKCLETEEKDELTKLTGLVRYQDFYSATSKTPTDTHTIAILDGDCGFGSMEKILKGLGYRVRYIKEDLYETQKIS